MGNCGSQFTDAYCGGLLSEELEAGPDIVGYGVRNQERRLEQTMKLTSPFTGTGGFHRYRGGHVWYNRFRVLNRQFAHAQALFWKCR